MKSICLIPLIAFSITASAQDTTQYATAPDLIIVKSKLRSIVRVDVTPSDIDKPSHFDVNPPRYEWHGKVELEVQNNGSKNIKSIYWEFFVMRQATSERMTRSYRIYSKQAIRPGQTVKVTGWIKDPTLKELRRPLKDGLLQGQAEIKRINYADGRIWLPLKVTPKQPI